MKKLYKNGQVARNGLLENSDILVDGDFIIAVKPNIDADAEVIDVKGKIILPKLFDEHTHGSYGVDFNLASVEEMGTCIDFMKTQMVGSVLPTLLTDEIDVLCEQMRKIVELSKVYPEVKGIHLEGPFLCSKYKGAMPEHLIKKPNMKDMEKMLKAGQGMVRLMTISPETEGAVEFIKEVTKQGVSINLGHSGATYEQTMACIEAGATGFTHLFNAMQPLNHHHLGICGVALLSDEYCETIMDGKHLNEHVVELILKCKGIDKMIAITDSIMAGGLPDGEYKLGVNDVTVIDGDARLTVGNARAGSTLRALDGLKNLVKFTGLPIEKAIVAMSENPARHCNLFDITGSIDEGKRAELFIYE